jgi:hypothetical protein
MEYRVSYTNGPEILEFPYGEGKTLAEAKREVRKWARSMRAWVREIEAAAREVEAADREAPSGGPS